MEFIMMSNKLSSMESLRILIKQMSRDKLRLVTLVLSLFVCCESSFVAPISECLSNCYACKGSNVTQCIERDQNCLKGYTLQEDQCIINKTDYNQIQFQDKEGQQFKNSSLTKYQCRGPKKSENMTLWGKTGNDFVRKMQAVMIPECKNGEIEIYFNIVHTELLIFNEYIFIEVKINGKTRNTDQFSYTIRKRQSFPLVCGGLNMKVSKFMYKQSSNQKIQTVSLEFYGYMIKSTWAIDDPKVIYPCQNCFPQTKSTPLIESPLFTSTSTPTSAPIIISKPEPTPISTPTSAPGPTPNQTPIPALTLISDAVSAPVHIPQEPLIANSPQSPKSLTSNPEIPQAHQKQNKIQQKLQIPDKQTVGSRQQQLPQSSISKIQTDSYPILQSLPQSPQSNNQAFQPQFNKQFLPNKENENKQQLPSVPSSFPKPQQNQKKQGQRKVNNNSNRSNNRSSQRVASEYLDGSFYIQSVNMRPECKIEIMPRNVMQKVRYNILSIQMTCPATEQIKSVRVGIDKLNPYEQRVETFRGDNGKVFVEIRIDEPFTSGILEIYSVKPTPSQQLNESEQNQANSTLRPQIQLPKLLNAQLLKQFPVNRFDIIAESEVDTIISFRNFFYFVAWLSIIGMICALFVNKGLVWEELLLGNQMAFLIVYIFTQYLPLNMKEAYYGLSRIQRLNYLPTPLCQSIEQSVSNGIPQQSPLRFTEYRSDINFIRNFYPVIIINVILIVWLLILLLAAQLVSANSESSAFKRRFVRFAKKTTQSKMRFFDQIWRCQFLATIWACFLQFYNFSYPQNSTNAGSLNAILCLFSFFATISWPVIFFLYARRQLQRSIKWESQIPDVYLDILFLKRTGLQNENKEQKQLASRLPQQLPIKLNYRVYPLIRYGKLMYFAIACSFLGQIPLFALFMIGSIMLFQIIFVLHNGIFKDRIYLATRISENLLFVIMTVLMIVVYTVGTHADPKTYFGLGYAILSITIIIVVNGLFRAAYLIYVTVQSRHNEADKFVNSENGICTN